MLITSLLAAALLTVPADTLPAADSARATTIDSALQRPAAAAPGASTRWKMIYLKEMVISATRTELTVRRAPASVTIIIADSLEPARSVQSALSQIAGATLGSTGGTGSAASLYLRGAASENVLVLLDGIPLNSSLMGGYDLAKVPGTAGAIEVVRGPVSNLYGANAVAGVVNITTPEPDSGRPYSRVTYEKGDYGAQQLKAKFSRSLARGLFLWLGADWTSDGGQRTNAAYDGTNYSIGASAGPLRGWSAKGYFQAYKAKTGVPGPTYWPSSLNTQWDDQQDVMLRLGHHFQANGAEQGGSLAIARSTINTKFLDSIVYTNKRSQQSTVDGQYTYILLPGYSLTAGGSYQRSQCHSDESGDHTLRQRALFASNLYSGIDGLLLTAGTRYDKCYYFTPQLSPSLAASYVVSAPVTVYASYGQSFRAPTINELFWKDPFMSGNSDLRPERSWQVEAGTKDYRDGCAITGSVFYRATRDLIIWTVQPDWSYRTENMLNARTVGVEVALAVRPLSWLRADLNYTYCRSAKDDGTGSILPYHPQNMANASLAVDDLRLAQKLWWGWRFNVHYTDCQNPGPYYASVLPSTVICDQTFSFKIWNARIYCRVDNLFDANYQTRYGYPMPRRSYAAGISMEMWE